MTIVQSLALATGSTSIARRPRRGARRVWLDMRSSGEGLHGP